MFLNYTRALALSMLTLGVGCSLYSSQPSLSSARPFSQGQQPQKPSLVFGEVFGQQRGGQTSLLGQPSQALSPVVQPFSGEQPQVAQGKYGAFGYATPKQQQPSVGQPSQKLSPVVQPFLGQPSQKLSPVVQPFLGQPSQKLSPVVQPFSGQQSQVYQGKYSAFSYDTPRQQQPPVGQQAQKPSSFSGEVFGQQRGGQTSLLGQPRKEGSNKTSDEDLKNLTGPL